MNIATKKAIRKFAPDWETLPDSEVQYSKSLDLYYLNGRHYDELSASHNGIIGTGAQLRNILREKNNEN